MKTPRWLFPAVSVLALIALVGCARGARDTRTFAITDNCTVKTPFNDAWQMVKAVLREQGYDIDTRDKRGVFVVFTGAKHKHVLGLHRTKYTISLQSVSDSSTQIIIESIRQVYGSTLLTYPGWHDRKTEEHAEAQAILKAVEAKVPGASAESTAPPTKDATPASG